MQAFVRDRYGSPDVLRLEEVDKPELTEDGALVRVRATSINAHDWHMLRGKPYIARLDELPAAIRHVEAGRARGKVVVTL